MKESLDAYREPFKAVVLKHLRRLPTDEWQRLRAFAADRSRYVDRKDTAELAATPEKLLDSALSEDSISVDETLVPAFKAQAVEIGEVEGQPVRYITGQGIYLWGLEPKRGLSLSFWAPHPEYPPAW